MSSAERHRARPATLVFVERGEELLLRRQPAHADRFPGCWNGLGGHVEQGEDVRAAAVREVREEACVSVARPRLRCVLHEAGLLGHAYLIFVFLATWSHGRPRAPDGAELAWQHRDRLAELPLVPDLPALVSALSGNVRTLFGVERYDGGDRPVELVLEGRRVPI